MLLPIGTRVVSTRTDKLFGKIVGYGTISSELWSVHEGVEPVYLVAKEYDPIYHTIKLSGGAIVGSHSDYYTGEPVQVVFVARVSEVSQIL